MSEDFFEKKEKICQMCGAVFEGCANARFCHPCRKKRKKENVKRWAETHRERRLQQLREYRERRKKMIESLCDYGEPPKIAEDDYFLGDEKRYCGAYNPNDLSCIKCYENQIKEYKSCCQPGEKK